METGSAESKVVTKWSNGNVHKEYTLVNGQIHGTHRTYHQHEVARLHEETEYRAGRRDGRYRRFTQHGLCEVDCHYQQDRLEGKYVTQTLECYYKGDRLHGSYIVKDHRGRVLEKHNYFEDQLQDPSLHYVYGNEGTVQTTEYREGKANGLQTCHYASGAKYFTYEMRHGMRHGPCQGWYPSGGPLDEGTYVDGKLEGLFIKYHENGTKSSEIMCCAGLFQGKYTGWFPDGKPEEEVFYRDSKFHGPRTKWNVDGVVESLTEHVNGDLSKIVTARDEKYRDYVIPEGTVDVWKACRSGDGAGKNLYVRITVPADARRVTPVEREGETPTYKSRVEHGVVAEIIDSEGTPYTEATSFVHTGGAKITYVVGQEVRPDRFDPDVRTSCGAGINVHRYRDHCDIWWVGR